MLGAEARRVPIWKNGRVVSSLPVDLVPVGDGTIDAIYLKATEKPLLLQVTAFNTNGNSNVTARRRKLRDIIHLLPVEHLRIEIWAWERDAKAFRRYLREEDYLEKGHRVSVKDGFFEVEKAETPTQLTLE